MAICMRRWHGLVSDEAAVSQGRRRAAVAAPPAAAASEVEFRRHDGRRSAALKAVHVEARAGKEEKASEGSGAGNPDDFRVCGPRRVLSPSWMDFLLFRSNWRDPDYKRVAMACFIQAAYLLELDRQEKRRGEDALAPDWWKPFKFKLVRPLVDGRDGSIYGALFEWDAAAALADFVVARPSGAPRAVLALRGTLLTGGTIVRDLEDDLRLLGWESLKGSVRFGGATAALKAAVAAHGDGGVWVAGHSLGAGLALLLGKAMAEEGAFVECHLFNPPSISLSAALSAIGEAAGARPKRNRAWVPHLYVNQSDYTCYLYAAKAKDKDEARTEAERRLFFVSKGPNKFPAAHQLEQWWADDLELQRALDDDTRRAHVSVPSAS
ncbi:GDSL esterase/lipase At4g10955-like [Wolffia australiana]